MNVMKFCPECYKELPPSASTCPFCGSSTGNGEPEQVFKPPAQTTTQHTSSIPLEQTILSLLIIALCFWGLSTAFILLPPFINPNYTDQMLLVGIVAQVILRVPVGIWAIQEQTYHKNLSTEKKIGSFLLTFIPLGAIVPFFYAAKGTIRKDRLSEISVGAVGAIALSAAIVYASMDTIMVLRGIEDPNLAAATILDPTPLEPSLEENQQAQPTPDAEQDSTENPEVQPTPFVDPTCQDPSLVNIEDEEKALTVCGKVTNYGDIECETCPGGYYSFIKLNDTFQVVSYDWQFTFAWLGDCLKVADNVEILGDKPVFVFGKGEGYGGTECSIDFQGELICEGGIYFQDYFGCQE